MLFWLPLVQAPTLLIVDEPDARNDMALERLAVAVGGHALRWFSRYLRSGA